MRPVKLREVVQLIRGVTFAPADLVAATEPNAVACLRTKNVQRDVELADVLYLPAGHVRNSEQFVLAGDVLISTANSAELVGKCARVRMHSGWPASATIGGFISLLRANSGLVDSDYLYWWLVSDAVQTLVRACARQTTNIANLSTARFLDLELPLPPLDEQRRIADILDAADALRRKRREALRLLDELQRATFLEMFGDPVTNPKGWPEVRLDTIANIASGITKGRAANAVTRPVPYMRVANVLDGRISLADVRSIDATDEEIGRYALSAGDILLTEGGDPDKLGRGAVWRGTLATCIHQNHVFRVRCDGSKANPHFVSAALSSERGKSYFARAAKQTTGIASINMTQLRAAPVLLPPNDEQRAWTRFLSSLDEARANVESHRTTTETFFAALLDRAFRGDL